MNLEPGSFQRYRDLQAYLEWSDEDAERVRKAAPVLEPFLLGIIDDFYQAIEANEGTRHVISGGAAQIARLKKTLLAWLHELLVGNYDEAYFHRRWKVGWRHVEIGLDPVYPRVALSRIRSRLMRELHRNWVGSSADLEATIRSLVMLLDLDLTIIEDAYRSEFQARQQRVERLATIGQVAGGVAHEMRNPLNVIKTSVYYLINARNPTPVKQSEHLKRIERHVELADGVITTLSNFAKMPVPTAQAFSLRDCIRNVLENHSIPGMIEVVLEIPDDLPSISADPDQIEMVFANLVRNARDAMSEGGRLTISGTQVGDALEIQVADTGVGIAPDDLTRIMEPLYTTKSRGLGLGLAIARAILDKNRGALRVESRQGVGTQFTVQLPHAPIANQKASAL